MERYDEARAAAREALTLGRDFQLEVHLVLALQHLAVIDGLASGNRERAARLLGYTDSRLDTLEVSREYTEQQEYDRLLTKLRHALGNDEFRKLKAEGSSWTEDRAVGEAMLV